MVDCLKRGNQSLGGFVPDRNDASQHHHDVLVRELTRVVVVEQLENLAELLHLRPAEARGPDGLVVRLEPLLVGVVLDDAHHPEELPQVDLPVAVLVDLLQECLCPCMSFFVAADVREKLLDEVCQVLVRDLSDAVRVEPGEERCELSDLNVREALIRTLLVPDLGPALLHQGSKPPQVQLLAFPAVLPHQLGQLPVQRHLARLQEDPPDLLQRELPVPVQVVRHKIMPDRHDHLLTVAPDDLGELLSVQRSALVDVKVGQDLLHLLKRLRIAKEAHRAGELDTPNVLGAARKPGKGGRGLYVLVAEHLFLLADLLLHHEDVVEFKACLVCELAVLNGLFYDLRRYRQVTQPGEKVHEFLPPRHGSFGGERRVDVLAELVAARLHEVVELGLAQRRLRLLAHAHADLDDGLRARPEAGPRQGGAQLGRRHPAVAIVVIALKDAVQLLYLGT
mmetsp:Transcript_98741/g.288034  ORF Transcript_98741/g.288034 Transcript_98741/m.288034 type:complete len:451 (+) Transcript_98741:311-1663(+)